MSDNNFLRKQSRIYELEEDSEENIEEIEMSTLFINLLETENTNDWFINVKIGNTITLNCKVDTGAQANVISEDRLEKFRQEKPKIFKTTVILRAFGGSRVKLLGECYLTVKFNNIIQELRFLVSRVDSKTILGLDACKKLGLINKIHELQYTDTHSCNFEKLIGNGNLKSVKIVLQENAVPHIASPRKIPVALHNSVREELNKMVNQGIITKVEEPTDWVSSLHFIHKSNGIRIVLDPRPLNKCIKRSHYPIPSIEELLYNMEGCKIFSLFDAKTAFWQQPLDKESSLLTTFTTPFGRYRYLKVPYGLISALENFQFTIVDIF